MLNTGHIKSLDRATCIYHCLLHGWNCIHMYMILSVGVLCVTVIPTNDGGSLWDYLVQFQEKVYIHIITH